MVLMVLGPTIQVEASFWTDSVSLLRLAKDDVAGSTTLILPDEGDGEMGEDLGVKK